MKGRMGAGDSIARRTQAEGMQLAKKSLEATVSGVSCWEASR